VLASCVPVVTLTVTARYHFRDARRRPSYISGVMQQPSGFVVVLKAQDEGCNDMMGS